MADDNSAGVVRGWLASLISRAVVGFFCFFVFIMGAFIWGAGLHDPDTCWLLALGKFVLDNGFVPTVDPFSYTFPALLADGRVDFAMLSHADTLFSGMPAAQLVAGGRAFVPYQWLTEVFFFLSYRLGGAPGLVALVVCVVVAGMVAAPLALFRRLRCSGLLGCTLIFVAALAASFHFLARPEIFSYLFLAVWFHLLAWMRLNLPGYLPGSAGDAAGASSSAGEQSVPKVHWPSVAAFGALMLVWANMHTAFTLALIVLAAFSICFSVESLCRGQRQGLLTPWVCLLAALSATLVNPFGTGLWAYLPDLFFSPINKFIIELDPISSADFLEWTYYPFFLLSIMVMGVLVRSLRQRARQGRLQPGWSFSALMIVVSIAGALYCRRIIPFTAIFLVSESAWLLRGALGEAGEERARTFRQIVDVRMHRILADGSWSCIFLLLGLLGVLLISTRVLEPTIPQESLAFKAPYKAMAYISEHAPRGRCLNDPQFGDMMIWYLSTSTEPMLGRDRQRLKVVGRPPRVFIDTRFDMYGPYLVGDYHAMANCKKGWREVFDRYHFDWIFLPPHSELSSKLDSRQWNEVYRDKRAIIWTRRATVDESQRKEVSPLDCKEDR